MAQIFLPKHNLRRRIQLWLILLAAAGTLAIGACSGSTSGADAPAAATSAPAAIAATAAPSIPPSATRAAAVTPGTTAGTSAAATPVATSAAIVRVSANTASSTEIQKALEAAGVPNAARWTIEVVEYRPYPADDANLGKLRQNLVKYNPAPDVVEKIVSALKP